MTAYIQAGVFAGKAYGMIKRYAVSHEGGRSNNSVSMSLQDAFVDVPREAEIIGIDNELLSSNQKIDSLILRNFFGLALKSFINP